MANPEHVAILKKGIERWNTWRDKNPKIHGDLTNADLRDVILSKGYGARANLEMSNLTGANLEGVNLTNAYLAETILDGANLRNARCNEADFFAASLRRTKLNRANLSGANFGAANLSRANLRNTELGATIFRETVVIETNFTGATFALTMLDDLDLSKAKGLEAVKHEFPSSIGIDTIYNSQGNIPETFLRGCGIPETFIEFSRSLVGKPIEFYSCFISYNAKDASFAERLHADLQSNGVRVWFAPEDLKIGDKFRGEIDRAIRIYDKLLIVLSGNSITSQWVEKEVETAFEKERQQNRTVLFPIRLDDAVMKTDQAWAADIRRTRHIGDFSHWKEHDHYQAAFERLLRDLKAEGKAPGE